MTIYQGTVEGNRIQLPEGVTLPDGTTVEIHLIANSDGLLPGDDEAIADEAEDRAIEAMIANGELDAARRPLRVRGRPASRLLIEDRR